MDSEKTVTPAHLPGRGFCEMAGVILQEPTEIIFYSKRLECPGKFSICINVGIALIHGLKGGDTGVDVFWATLIAEDQQSQIGIARDQDDQNPDQDRDIENRYRNESITRRRFDDVNDLIAWLKSPHLEDAVRIGIVNHPPAPIPSPERDLATALFGFAADIKDLAKHFPLDMEMRQNMCPYHKKIRSNQ